MKMVDRSNLVAVAIEIGKVIGVERTSFTEIWMSSDCFDLDSSFSVPHSSNLKIRFFS